MYALPNSLLQRVGEYKTEIYRMELLSHQAIVNIHLNIFGVNPHETYLANYEVIRLSDELTTNGTCNGINKTKEDTLKLVEDFATKAMEDKDRYWS
ncbi:hypothetical protein LZ480_07870 [Solibacillus sp. MA9]|uniref:Uncharacterized protein n=1 Tax=Solibacillus palustris TaxID=2908203 RepID=A0ABS9UCE9_9BACL|nr:hypothetical protein [Solibacillus sp. MA9]MCH7321810.1 hypothetical protein [Solibacillus sp. MA9]